MSIPIWVTDPAGNDDPFLKLVIKALFVEWNTGGTMWWSEDGLAWTQVTTPASGLPGLGGQTLAYNQGMWAAQFQYTSGFGWMTSTDGKKWTQAVISSDGANFSETYDKPNNRWKFTLLEAPNTVTFVNNPNPLDSNGNFTLFADALQGTPFMTPQPAQPAATDFPGSVGHNALPSSMTAVRYLFQVYGYTTTSITDTIVNSGLGWPGASWVTPSGWTNGPGVDTGLMSFGKIGAGS